MKRRQGQPTITSFFKKPKADNLDDAANVDKNFPNNSECSEQSNLSFKVNSGPKTNFRVEDIDEENEDKISHLDSDDNISDPVTSTGFQEIVHPVWQANRFDIGNTNRNSLDDTTKKMCFQPNYFQKNHTNSLQKNHTIGVFNPSGLLMILLGWHTQRVKTACIVNLAGYFSMKALEKGVIKIQENLCLSVFETGKS
ncbi:hypothetical protein TNCT_672461 [Trichonephila clavata]|uniref:Uncharacterized protein n=1 Tax=Trichonephila clavata TaxID=2740835 RepID=A0A8X6FGJ0_TRICU|nr:hypothetical protein TNCT_672461 [Trichonephila clavata]